MKRKGAIAEFFFEPIDQQVILSFVSHLIIFFIKPDKKNGSFENFRHLYFPKLSTVLNAIQLRYPWLNGDPK